MTGEGMTGKTMTCAELQPDYTTWALGIAEEPERSEIASHLARHCDECTKGVASALATVAAMAGGVEPAEPPARLRGRVVALVSPSGVAPSEKSSWFSLMPWVLAGALAVALVSVAVPGYRQGRETAKLEQALAILNDPLAKDVSFGDAKPSRGRVFVSPSRGVVFIGASLPKLEPGKTFQLWVIPAGGKPVSGGTFRAGADSTAVYVSQGPVDSAAAAVAVTVEPEGGSPQPTTTPFIVAALRS